MSEKDVRESQKTVVAFIAGLLVGGLLVWIFSVNPNKAEAPAESDDMENVSDQVEEGGTKTTVNESAITDNTLPMGDGSAVVNNQAAGSLVKIVSASFPTEEGWIAVRDYNNGQMGYILGAIAYSKSANRIPAEIPLIAPTVKGSTYAIVFFSQDGNRAFNLDGDVQLNTPLSTFVAE